MSKPLRVKILTLKEERSFYFHDFTVMSIRYCTLYFKNNEMKTSIKGQMNHVFFEDVKSSLDRKVLIKTSKGAKKSAQSFTTC